MTLESSVSDAPNCGITYYHHSDGFRGSFMLLESSIMHLENIYSTGVTHDDHHLQSSYLYSAGHRFNISDWYFCGYVPIPLDYTGQLMMQKCSSLLI
jgi:hypothetical protein